MLRLLLNAKVIFEYEIGILIDFWKLIDFCWIWRIMKIDRLLLKIDRFPDYEFIHTKALYTPTSYLWFTRTYDLLFYPHKGIIYSYLWLTRMLHEGKLMITNLSCWVMRCTTLCRWVLLLRSTHEGKLMIMNLSCWVKIIKLKICTDK